MTACRLLSPADLVLFNLPSRGGGGGDISAGWMSMLPMASRKLHSTACIDSNCNCIHLPRPHRGLTPPPPPLSPPFPGRARNPKSPPRAVPPAMDAAARPDEPAATTATTTHAQGRFRIATRKLPISKVGAIDALTERIGIPMPEMIFGDNLVRVAHAPSGWSVAFAAPDALDAVDKTGRHVLKVAYARDWESSREAATRTIRDAVKPYDWTYSTAYRGTVVGAPFAPTQRRIPVDLLRRRDSILFFDDVVLYESELDDNGVSVYSAKLRVHEKRMLLLCRLFMRLDNVVVRIRDTRLYVDFDTDEVLREYTAKEASFAHVKQVQHICPRALWLRMPVLTTLFPPPRLGIAQDRKATRRRDDWPSRPQRLGSVARNKRAANRSRQPRPVETRLAGPSPSRPGRGLRCDNGVEELHQGPSLSMNLSCQRSVERGLFALGTRESRHGSSSPYTVPHFSNGQTHA